MSDINAKIHQIRFPLGPRSRPRWMSLQRSSRPLTVFEGLLLSKERVVEGREGKGRKGKGEGRGDEVEKILVWHHLCQTHRWL